MKQHDRLELAQKYLISDPSASVAGLGNDERQTVANLRLCFEYIQEFPLASYKDKRDYLMETAGITTRTAYDIISVCEALVGTATLKGKNFAKIKVQALLDEAYKCIQAEDFKGSESRVKLAQTYIKAYRLDIDEGEAFDAARRAEFESIEFTTDLAAIGVTLTDEQRKANEKLKRENNFEDIDFEEVINGKGDD